ncbi:MAG: hypothetical protein WC711_00150 [Candidatus Staskawiczbacteria bacterium]|jgi:hypothetical protein
MFKIQKFEIIEIVLFVALGAIVLMSWNNNPQQQKLDNIKSVVDSPVSLDEPIKKKEISESLPTTNTTIKGFSNEIKALPPATPTKWEVGQDLYEEQKKQYGDLAVRFWADSNSITFLKEFDVDGDGQKETIIGICGLWGNHCPHEVVIIKNNKQVFSYSDTGVNVSLPESGSGFYIEWHTIKYYENGYCCPTGYMKTKFTFKDNKFIPVSEQEVTYINQ